MAGSKFELNIMQNLEAIAKMVEQGANDKDIYETCRVSANAWKRYLNKGKAADERVEAGEDITDDEEKYRTFWRTYAHARKRPDEIVEASLLKSCQDRTIDEVITIKRYDPEGNLMWVEEKTRKVPVAASVPAQQFYLANKKRKDWEYKPDAKVDNTDTEQKAIVLVEREKGSKK